MYENMNPPRTKKHEWGLTFIILVPVVLIILIFLPTVLFAGHINRFHDFMQDISRSSIASREEPAVCTVDGKSEPMTKEELSQLILHLLDGESGARRSRLPEEEPLTVAFSDGAVLQLWGTVMEDAAGGKPTPSVFVSYVGPRGKRFSYITHKISTAALADSLPGIASDWVQRGVAEE